MSWRDHKWQYGLDTYTITTVLLNRCPADECPGFWRYLGSLRVVLRVTGAAWLISGALALGEIAADLGWITRWLPGEWLLLFWVLFVIHSVLLVYGLRFARGHFKRLLLKNEWRICVACGYSLRGLPDRHQCPECGTEYEIETLAQQWHAWIERNVFYGDKS